MNKILFIFLTLVSSCKNDEIKYYNHEKWKWTTDVMGWWFYEHANNKPSEIKEYFYDGTFHDNQNYSRELPSYLIRRFNKEGNIIYEEEVYRDSTHFISEYSFNGEGIQMKKYAVHKAARWGFDENDTGRISTELLKNGKFKIKTYNASGVQPNPSYYLATFFNDGRKVVNEELFPKLIQDTINELIVFKGFSDSLEVIRITTKEYDDGDKIIKDSQTDTKRDGGYMYLYYYDKNDFLDSIVEKEKDIDRIFDSFVNNKYGDPVKSQNAIYEYVYDDKQNWIKRVAKFNNGTITVIREIKY